MSDEQQAIKRVDWKEVFAFTQIFKSFRMAIQPSKLLLGGAAVVLVGILGWVMDGLSCGAGGVCVPDREIAQYASMSSGAFQVWKEEFDKSRPAEVVKLWDEALSSRQSLESYLQHLGAEKGRGGYFEAALLAAAGRQSEEKRPSMQELDKAARENWRRALGKAETAWDRRTDSTEDLIEAASSHDANGAWALLSKDAALDTPEKKADAKAKLRGDIDAGWRALTDLERQVDDKVRQIEGRGVFVSFMQYEGQCLANALQAVAGGNVAGGLTEYRQMLQRRAGFVRTPPAQPAAPAAAAATPEPPGLLFWALVGLQGVAWLFSQHWLFAIILTAATLAIWAVLGGALHRMAALQYTREEKIPISQAITFAGGKFFSFYTAPLIPLGIVAVIGLFMIVGGLLMSLPVLDFIMAVLFPLAILGGLLMAFLLIGLVGGASLMYPTVAIESSDSFDAISRSYSYLYSRPWRAGLYALVALVYGAICYLFVRLFAYVALAVAHLFIGAGVIGGGARLSPTADKLDVLWQMPTFDGLLPPGPWSPAGAAMTGWETVVAFVIWVWVALVAAAVIGFLLSFCASASTVVYCLLRREVDAADLDDIYIEEEPEPAPVEAAPQPTEAPATAPSEEPKPAEDKEDKPAQ